MKTIYSAAVLTTLLLAFTACKKDHNPSPEKPKHLYAAATLNSRAAYMIDDSIYYLTPPTTNVLPSGIAIGGIFANKDTVYVAGIVQGASPFTNFKAVYWKNGVQTVIADNTSSYFEPRDIIVNAANEVIVAGVEWPSGMPNRAAYWKNGVLTPIGPSGVNSQAYAMAISGNDLYICGYIRDAATNKDVATLWKNGAVAFQHNGTNETSAQDLLIAGSDIYLSGWEYNNATNKGRAVYWKNGTFIPVSDTVRDEYNEGGMAVSGTDVYLLSNEYLPGTTGITTIVRYYKNGTPVQLSTGADFKKGESLAVLNGKVYVGGWASDASNNQQGILWKNGVLTSFPVARESKIHHLRVF